MSKTIDVGDELPLRDKVLLGAWTDLTSPLYELAAEFAGIAQKASEDKNETREVQYAIATLLVCVAALEAYINKWGYDNAAKIVCDVPNGEDPTEEFCRDKYPWKRVRTKWRDWPAKVAGQRISEDRCLWKSFEKLLDRRNIYCAHWVPGDQPHRRTRVKSFATTETLENLTADIAAESFETAKAMICRLHLLDGTNPPDWVHQCSARSGASS